MIEREYMCYAKSITGKWEETCVYLRFLFLNKDENMN